MKGKKVFISGGAGFIGSNIARHYLELGYEVVVYDNLSREGTEKNYKWLKGLGLKNYKFIRGDIRSFDLLKKSIKGSSIVFHQAAQVAVTTSIKDPREDFEVNALGTLNMLEAARLVCPKAVFIYSSTNKVYGELTDPKYKELETRYKFINTRYIKGVSEDELLDFHSPYGCSKGAGDQYTRDYHRVYGLKTVVFRQSCIYGPRQFGSEDQGWVIHLTRIALKGETIKIFGDGKQVRDILHINDLIDAYKLAISKINISSGKIYNLGGGVDNTISLLELISFLERHLRKKIKIKFYDWRDGDQKVYISDISLLEKELGWKPKIDKEKGLKLLLNWAKTI